MGEVNEFLKLHKGERVTVRFFVAPKGSSEALKGYYYNYVVPTVRRALYETGVRLTEEQTEKYLREQSTVMCVANFDISTSKYTTHIKEIAEIGNAELIEHIEFIKQFAAEELNTFIENPKTI
jgi:hypothetical protein